jgi:hypothetical protein
MDPCSVCHDPAKSLLTARCACMKELCAMCLFEWSKECKKRNRRVTCPMCRAVLPPSMILSPLWFPDEKHPEIEGKVDALSHALIARTTKKCPGCEVRVEKNGGCDRIDCRQCGVRFCWQCGHPTRDLPNGRFRCGCWFGGDQDRRDAFVRCLIAATVGCGVIASFFKKINDQAKLDGKIVKGA